MGEKREGMETMDVTVAVVQHGRLVSFRRQTLMGHAARKGEKRRRDGG